MADKPEEMRPEMTQKALMAFVTAKMNRESFQSYDAFLHRMDVEPTVLEVRPQATEKYMVVGSFGDAATLTLDQVFVELRYA